RQSISLLRRGSWVRVPAGSWFSRALPTFEQNLEKHRCLAGSFGTTETSREVTDRATSLRGNKATSSLETTRGATCEAGNRLRGIVNLWLSDGRARGWSNRKLTDRRHTMERLA